MKFHELFSHKISGNFTSLSKDSNKNIIESILKNKQINPIISFILNLELEDWIDFFTYKKEIKELENIEIKRSNILLDEIACQNKNDEIYCTRYFFLLYNYKWLFYNKKGKEN